MSRESYKAIERAKKIASMSMAEQRAYLESEKRAEPESDSADSLHGVVRTKREKLRSEVRELIAYEMTIPGWNAAARGTTGRMIREKLDALAALRPNTEVSHRDPKAGSVPDVTN